MKKVAGVALVASLAVFAIPAAADILPTPVIDVGPEQTTWASQLFQQVETQINTYTTQIQQYQQLRLQIRNAIPTDFGWPLASRGLSLMEPLLQSAEQRLNANRQTVQAQTGVPLPADAATSTAEDGMTQLAGEQNDLANAQTASDGAREISLRSRRVNASARCRSAIVRSYGSFCTRSSCRRLRTKPMLRRG